MKVSFAPQQPVTHQLTLEVSPEELRLLSKLFAANIRCPQQLLNDNDLSYTQSATLGELMAEVHSVIQRKVCDPFG